MATTLLVGIAAGRAAAQEKTEAGTRQYAVAADLQNRGEYELAAAAWAKFLKDFQTDARADRAQHYLGVCQLKANQLDTALASFQAVIKSYPKFEMLEATYLYLGITQYTIARGGKAELYDAAAATFDALLKAYPKGKHAAQALFYRGECAYARGNKQEAARAYAQIVEKYRDDNLLVDALYALGVAREELGEHATAAKSYDAFLEKFADHPLAAEVTMRRGECDFAANRFAEAAQRFAAAAGREGFALADHATLRQAAALGQLKQHDEAAALYAAFAQKFPKSQFLAAAMLAGGKSYFLAGKFVEAEKLLAAVVAAGGEPALEAAHWTARSLLKQNKPAESAAAAEKALAAAAQSVWRPQLQMDRADAVYEIADRRKEAVDLYAALAADFPKDANVPQAQYMAAFAALGVGDYAAALKHATAFLKDRKDHDLATDVSYIAAEASLQLKQFDEAEKLFDALIAKQPKHSDAETWRVRRGLAAFMQKKFKETIAGLTPALKQLRAPEALAEAQFLVGSSQAELKQFDAAAKSLEASLAASAAWRQADDALLISATVCGQLQQPDKAKAALARLVAEFPKSRVLDQAHYRLGEQAFAAGDWKAAAAEYQQVLDRWADSSLAPFALYGLGWTKLNEQDHAGAEKTFDALVEKHGEHKLIPRAKYARGVARQQLGKHAAAVADLEALLAADPSGSEKTDALYVLALCHAGLKQHAETAQALERLLAADARPAIADKVYYELGWALKSLDKEDKAAAAFAKVVELNADSPLAAECLYHGGEFAYKGNEFKRAAESYAAAAAKAGATELGEKATHKLGWAAYRQDDWAAAERAFAAQRKGWPAGPLAADAAFMQGECLFKQEKYAEAVAAYEAVTEPSGKDFAVLALLHGGQSLGQLKQWEKSLKPLQKLAKDFADSPYLPEALYEQGWAQKNLGKHAEAIALFEQVIAKTGREVAARAQFMIGEIQFEQKKHAEAVTSFLKVSLGYSAPKWQAEANYEAARCFEALGKPDQALKQYQELVEKYAESDKVPLAKERIAALKK